MKDLPNFSGKVVSFGLPDSTLAILNPKFEKQADRIFITGTIPEEHTKNDYALGNTCAVSWDSITDYIIFKNEKAYKKQMKKFAKKK